MALGEACVIVRHLVLVAKACRTRRPLFRDTEQSPRLLYALRHEQALGYGLQLASARRALEADGFEFVTGGTA
jgi:hypothetical protein